MHIPDGFIDVQTSAIFAGLAAAGVAASLKGARSQLDEKSAPLAGLTACLLYTSPSPRDGATSRMPSSA